MNEDKILKMLTQLSQGQKETNSKLGNIDERLSNLGTLFDKLETRIENDDSSDVKLHINQTEA